MLARSTRARSASKPGAMLPLPAMRKRRAGFRRSCGRCRAAKGRARDGRIRAAPEASIARRRCRPRCGRSRRRISGRADGGMVGGDPVYISGKHALPESVAIRGGTERRRALGDGAEPLHIVFREEEVMRTGLDRHIDARARASRAAATPRPELTWTMCSFAPASRASSAARWMASTSAITGREARKSAMSPRAGSANAAGESGGDFLALGMDRDRQPEARRLAHALRSSVRSSARGNSGSPESHRKALKPTTPRFGQRRQFVDDCRGPVRPTKRNP